MEPVGADDGPPVDSQGHLDQQQSQETPEEEEGVELAENWVDLVVTSKISSCTQLLSFPSKFNIPDVQHAGGCLGQDEASVDQVGDGEEDDEDCGGIASNTSGAEENIQCYHVE